MCRSKGDDALVRASGRQPLNCVARLKPHGDVFSSAEVDNFLDSLSAGALGDENTIKGPPGGKGFANRMNADENGHGDRITCDWEPGENAVLISG